MKPDARNKGALIQGCGPAEPALVVDTLGGHMHVRLDKGAAATSHGQLAYFAEFPAAAGVFDRCVSACPMTYRSGNAPDKRDELGLQAGHQRYTRIIALRCAALRGAAVAAQALGMYMLVSEDALRRALGRR